MELLKDEGYSDEETLTKNFTIKEVEATKSEIQSALERYYAEKKVG